MQLDIRGGIKVGILKQQDSGSGNIKINAGLITLLFLSILFFFPRATISFAKYALTILIGSPSIFILLIQFCLPCLFRCFDFGCLIQNSAYLEGLFEVFRVSSIEI